MSKKVLTVDLATGKKQLVTVIDNAANAVGRDDMAYSALAVDDKVSAIGSTIAQAITDLKSGTTFQNTVQDVKYNTNQVKNHIDGGRYAIGNTIKIFHAGVDQVGIITEPLTYVAPVAPFWSTDCTVVAGTRLVNMMDSKEYQYDGSKWIDATSLQTYVNAVSGIFDIVAHAPETEGVRFAIGNTIQVFQAEISTSGTAGKVGYIPSSAKFWSIVGTVVIGSRVVNLADSREYQFDGTIWKDVTLNDLTVVHVTGDQSIAGKKEFSDAATFDSDVKIVGNLEVDGDISNKGNLNVDKNLTVAGNLLVAGTTTQINTENLTIKDNFITLNDGDLGATGGQGITLGAAGIEINRGTSDGSSTGTKLPSAIIEYNEAEKTFQAGLDGSLQNIALINDNPVSTSVTETFSVKKINAIIDGMANVISSSTLFSYNASAAVTTGQILAIDINGKVFPADSTNVDCIDSIAGVCMAGALEGFNTAVAKFGKITRFGGLISGSVYFLGLDGALTTTCPSAVGDIIVKIGTSTDDSTLLLQIGEGVLIGA